MWQEPCCLKSTSTSHALRLYSALAALFLTLSPLQPPLNAQERVTGVDYFVGAGILYDDNLFRQPEGYSLSSGGNTLHRQDQIERLSAGVKGLWTLGRQSFELKAHGDENRFEQNDNLNNLSGNGAITWDWRVGNRWSGRLGADYGRALANFANNILLDKDLLTQRGSFAGASFELGPHWIAHADVRWASTSHSAEVRRLDNSNIRTQKFGVELKLSSTDSVGWNYRHANANFAGDVVRNDENFDRRYDESSSVVWLKYALSGKTDINCEGGYLRRNYPNAVIGSFSGATGRVSMTKPPRAASALAGRSMVCPDLSETCNTRSWA